MANYGDQQPKMVQPSPAVLVQGQTNSVPVSNVSVVTDYGGQQPNMVQPPPAVLVQGQTNGVPVSNVSVVTVVEYAARGLSILCTLIASAVMGSAKVMYSYNGVEIASIKFSTYSALQYFVAANAIVLFFSIISLIMSILFKSRTPALKLVISVLDLIAISFLLTGNGAACAIISSQFDNIDGVYEYKTCDIYKGFCSKVKASIAFSFLAAFMYLLLISLAHKRN